MPTEWAKSGPGGGGLRWAGYGLEKPEDEMQAARERRERDEEMPGDYDSDCSEFGNGGDWAHDPESDLESDEQPPAADQPDKPLPAVEQPAAPSSAAPSAIIPSSSPPSSPAPSAAAQPTKANAAAGRSPAARPSPPATPAPSATLPPHLRATATQPSRAPTRQTSSAKSAWPAVAVPVLPQLRPSAPAPSIAKDPTNPDTRDYCCHASYMKGCPHCDFLAARSLYNEANGKLDALLREQEAMSQAAASDETTVTIEEREIYKHSQKDFDKVEARRLKLHGRVMSLKTQRDKFKAESMTKPGVWDDAAQKVIESYASVRKEKFGGRVTDQPLREFADETNDTSTSSGVTLTDRKAIPGSADYALDMPRGCQSVNQVRQRQGGLDPLEELGKSGVQTVMMYGSTLRPDILGMPKLSSFTTNDTQKDVSEPDDLYAHEEQAVEVWKWSTLKDQQVKSEAEARRAKHAMYGTERYPLSHSEQLNLLDKIADPYYLTTLYANQTESLDRYSQRRLEDEAKDQAREEAPDTKAQPPERMRTFGGVCSWMQNNLLEAGGSEPFNEILQSIQHATQTDPTDTKDRVMRWRGALPKDVRENDPVGVTRDKDDKGKEIVLRARPADFFPPGDYPNSYSQSPRLPVVEAYKYWDESRKTLGRFAEWRRRHRSRSLA